MKDNNLPRSGLIELLVDSQSPWEQIHAASGSQETLAT